jgi:hypothetical protein
MAFKYSSFFSYRRNQGELDYMRLLKNLIQTEAHTATNIREIFFDEQSIDHGREFDIAIYTSIISSYSFVFIITPHYLSLENLWCAKEIFRAIEFEKAIREKLGNDQFCFIFPYLHRGSAAYLPSSIRTKNIKDLSRYETSIINSIVSEEVTQLKRDICDVLSNNYEIISQLSEDMLIDIVEKLEIPDDPKIIDWVKTQKRQANSIESQNLPIIK